MTTTPNWKRTVGAKVARMSREEALAALAAIRADGSTIFSATVRELTGGFNSQSINWYVIRKLGVKAGVIKNPA